MIVNEASTNKDGLKGPMLIERMIDTKEANMEVEDFIAKARTYGITISEHGFN